MGHLARNGIIVVSAAKTKRAVAAVSTLLVTVALAAAVHPAAASATSSPSPLDPLPRPATAAKYETGESDGEPTNEPTKTRELRYVAKDGEIRSMRTEYSETRELDDGLLRTTVSTAPLHYKQDGQWKDIDNTLVRSGPDDKTYENAASDVEVSVPARADGVTRVSDGDDTITTKAVTTAPSVAVVNGDDATYKDVQPHVDQQITAQHDGFEQTYILKDSQAPASYAATVTVPEGAELRTGPGRAATVIDADGAAIANLPAPVAYDSSGVIDQDTSNDVHYSISGSAPTYTVTTTLDQEWLHDPARVFPVRLDPSINFGGGNQNISCYTNRTGTNCSRGSGTDNFTTFGQTGTLTRRSYLQFDDLTNASSQIPANAIVTNATLKLSYVQSQGTATSLDTLVRQVNDTWDESLDWDHQPSFDSKWADRKTITPPSSAGQLMTFNPTYLVAAWIRHDIPNRGIALTAKDESSATDLALRFQGFANPARPVLTVDWRPQVGQDKAVGAYDHKLSDRLDLHVGYGTRNLVVNDTDATLTGPGQSMVARRTYNSLNAANGYSGAYGQGWALNGGTDVQLLVNRSNVTLVGAGGALTTFGRNFNQSDVTQDDAFRKPIGLHSVLTKPDSTHYRLKNKQSKTRMTFTLSADGTFAWLSEINNHEDGSGTTKLNYDASGSPLRTTKLTNLADNNDFIFEYGNSSTGPVASMREVTGGTNRSWSYQYNDDGRLQRVTNAAGNYTYYCYNSSGLLSRIITPRGVASGATCSTNSGGTDVTDIAYDSTGAVTSITYQNGSAADAITVTFAATVPIGSNPKGKTRFTDPYGRDTLYSYNETNRVLETLNPLGYTSKSAYNLNGDVTASVSPNNFTGGSSDSSTTSSFDANFNKTSTTVPTGASAQSTYTDTANSDLPSTTTDDRNKTTSYTRNSNGQSTSNKNGVIEIKTLHDGDDDPDSSGTIHCGPSGGAAFKGATCETRDGEYKSASPTLHRTKMTYNSLGQMVTLTPASPANGRSTPPNQTFTYDAQSRIKTITSSRGKLTTFTYDELDRVTRTTYNNGSYSKTTYDPDGNVQEQGDYDASDNLQNSVSYTYDSFNRPATETKNGQPTISYTWDANSNMLTFTDDVGTTRYGYNTASQLTSVALAPSGDCSGATPANPPPASNACVVFDLDRNGARISTTYPGNFARQATVYDKSGRITRVTGTGQGSSGYGSTLFDFKYDYKSGTVDTNHIVTRTDVAGSNSTVGYEYTDQGRLRTATSKNSNGDVIKVLTYCYDKNGNITRRDDSSSTGADCASTSFTSSFDGANQQLTGPGGSASAFTYDLDGDETSTATALPNASMTRTTTWSDMNQSLGVTLNGASSGSSSYLGASQDLLLKAGVSTSTYDDIRNTSLGVSRINRKDTSGNTTSAIQVTRDSGGQLVSLRDASGARYYPLVDNQGSVLRMVDSNGVVADSYSYDPFGIRTVNSNTFAQPFGYTGAYTNPTTGLVHLGARQYDPTLGRFTSRDPQSHPGDISQASPFSYAGDDPVNHTDGGGQNFFDDALTLVSNAASLVGTVAAFVPGGQGVAGIAEGVGLAADGLKTAGDALGVGTDDVGGDVAGLAVDAATGGVGHAAEDAGATAISHGADFAGLIGNAGLACLDYC